MTAPLDLYLSQLEDAAARLRTTRYVRLKTDLNRYLHALEAHPLAKRAVSTLERAVDLQGWLDDLGNPFSDDPPEFPNNPQDDIAVRLGLMRQFAADPEGATNFGIRLTAANDYDTLVEAVVDTVVRPLLSDLPDVLLGEISLLERQGGPDGARIVVVEPDAASWVEVLTALDKLSGALKAEPESPEGAQRLGELVAAGVLIRSGRFRPEALRILLVNPITPDPARREIIGLVEVACQAGHRADVRS